VGLLALDDKSVGLLALGLKKGLQDEDGGDLVNDSLAGATVCGVAGIVKLAMGLSGGQALIPQVDGDAGFGGEGLGELLRLGGLGAEIAGHVERIAHDDMGAGVLAQQAGEGFEVGATSGAVEGEEGLRGVTQLVGYGHANAPVADVEGDDALNCWVGQNRHELECTSAFTIAAERAN